MPTRGEVKVFKPKMSDAYALCNELHDGQCTCQRKGKRPCVAWLDALRHCYALKIDDVVAYEKDRMKRDARN